jgi:hypothetical protein
MNRAWASSGGLAYDRTQIGPICVAHADSDGAAAAARTADTARQSAIDQQRSVMAATWGWRGLVPRTSPIRSSRVTTSLMAALDTAVTVNGGG